MRETHFLKRVTALLLALVMSLSLACTTAFAENGPQILCTGDETCTAETHDPDCPKAPLCEHTWSSEWTVTKPATCEEDGEETRTCTLCGEKDARTVTAAGHQWGEWEITLAPTSEAEGQQTRICAVCGKTETETLPPLEQDDSDAPSPELEAFLAAAEVLWELNEEDADAETMLAAVADAEDLYKKLSPEEHALEEVAAYYEALVAFRSAVTLVDDPVAMVGENEYATLQAAIGAIPDAGSGTVTLCGSISDLENLIIKNKNVTLNLNNHNITLKPDNSIIVKGIEGNATLDVTGSGIIKSSRGSKYYETIAVYGYVDNRYTTNVTIGENVTIENDGSYGISIYPVKASDKNIYAAGITVDINGTIAADYCATVSGNVKYKDQTPVFNLSATGKMTGYGGKTANAGLYAAGYAEYNIAGTLEGLAAGIIIKSGTLNVAGTATVSCVGEYKAPTTAYGNGANASGAAIQIEANSSYAGDIKVNVEDGATVRSTNGDAIYQYAKDAASESQLSAITITGGNFSSGTGEGIAAITVDEQTKTGKKVSISGGTFSSDVTEYVADGVQANEGNGGWTIGPATGENYAATAGSKSYTTLQDAINATQSGTVTLLKNITESVTIDAGKDIVLDLNGHKIVDSNSPQDSTTAASARNHTITNKGTLTIRGTGAVDNVSHGKAAVYNDGTITLAGGTYTRSAEKGYYDESAGKRVNGGNSWYVVRNNSGTMNIENGAIIQGTSGFSSMVSNGSNNNGTVLNINGGLLESKSYVAIQNQIGCTLNISGGTVEGTGAPYCLSLYGTTNISGTAEVNGWVQVWSYDFYAANRTEDIPVHIQSTLNISGGVINDTQLQAVHGLSGYDPAPTGERLLNQNYALWGTGDTKSLINITGGTINMQNGLITCRVTNEGGPGRGIEEVTNGDAAEIRVSGGTFSTPVESQYCAEGYVPVQSGGRYGVTPEVPITGLTLNQTSATLTTSATSNTVTLTATVEPENTTDDHTVTWTSSDEGVVTVNNGVVTAVGEGTATITATAGDQNATCEVTVVHVHEHTWGDSVVTEPTCTEQGYTTYTCACGETKEDDHVAALGHTWDGGVVTTRPTYTAAGVRTFTCTRCGETRTEAIDRLTYDRDPGDIGSSSRPSTPNTPSVTVPDEPTPLDPGTEISDQDVPLASIPIPFVDVQPGVWHRDAVAFVFSKGIMGGTSDTTFAPEAKLNRGMLVTMLHRLEGTPDAPLSAFTDVRADQYWAEAIGWASWNGVVLGYSDTEFAPSGNITREQLAAILFRYAQLKGYDTSARSNLSGYSDHDSMCAKL